MLLLVHQRKVLDLELVLLRALQGCIRVSEHVLGHQAEGLQRVDACTNRLNIVSLQSV